MAYFTISRRNVSIHALLAECDEPGRFHLLFYYVSIHALLAECDTLCIPIGYVDAVSIHALLAECDLPKMGTKKST